MNCKVFEKDKPVEPKRNLWRTRNKFINQYFREQCNSDMKTARSKMMILDPVNFQGKQVSIVIFE